MSRIPKRTTYRIFIRDGRSTFCLQDIIVHDKKSNPVFNTEISRAMTFFGFDAAKKMRDRLVAMNYHPHIEQIGS